MVKNCLLIFAHCNSLNPPLIYYAVVNHNLEDKYNQGRFFLFEINLLLHAALQLKQIQQTGGAFGQKGFSYLVSRGEKPVYNYFIFEKYNLSKDTLRL